MTKYVCRCGYPARWHVWYHGFAGLLVGGANIAYNTRCTECVTYELEHGSGGFSVACVKSIPVEEERPSVPS